MNSAFVLILVSDKIKTAPKAFGELHRTCRTEFLNNIARDFAKYGPRIAIDQNDNEENKNEKFNQTLTRSQTTSQGVAKKPERSLNARFYWLHVFLYVFEFIYKYQCKAIKINKC